MKRKQSILKDYTHWCSEPDRYEKGMAKRRKTISENYTKADIQRLRSNGAKKQYQNARDKLDKIELLSLDSFLQQIKNINLTKYYGKTKQRSMIKDCPDFYKALIHYTQPIIKKYWLFHIPLSLRLHIASNNLVVNTTMLCKCKSHFSFDKQTQNFTKKYCRKCQPRSRSPEWYQDKYGDTWQEERIKYNDKYLRKTIYNRFITVGQNEEQILDFIEKVNNIKILRVFPVDPFVLDGYCEETNTVYEVYERYHLSLKQKKTDKRRQCYITNKLKCRFVIIYDIDRPMCLNNLKIDYV